MNREAGTGESNPRVLIVDDSRLMRVAAKKILRESFDVVEADDGEAGWEILASDPSISVVISDLSMPRLDGLGLLGRIRESDDERVRDLPVVVITGAEDEEGTRQEALGRGATDFITKPFNSVHLLARVKAQAHHTDTRRTLTKTTAALEAEAKLDPLTQLANQRYFGERGAKDLSFAVRHRQALSVAVVGVDNFDRLFLDYGKVAANAVVLEVSKRLRDSVRQEDTPARTGLASFGLILPGTDAMGAVRLAERIHQALCEAKFIPGGVVLPVTLSMGLASRTVEEELSFSEMVQNAEAQLAKAMGEGGNRIAGGAEQPAPAPELPAALEMLSAGRTEELVAHLPALLQKVMPLVEWANQRLGLEIDEALDGIKRRLKP